MPNTRNPQPRTRTRTRKEPRFLQIARRFYGEAFDATRPKDLSAAMADWTELNEDEQAFTIAHLHYLGLLAQARTQALLLQIRDLLDEVAEGLEPEEDEDEDADGFDGDEDLPPEPEEQPEDEPVLDGDQDDAEPQAELPGEEE
jgi:hypothetical protein